MVTGNVLVNHINMLRLFLRKLWLYFGPPIIEYKVMIPLLHSLLLLPTRTLFRSNIVIHNVVPAFYENQKY
jgi:hypothetical protein